MQQKLITFAVPCYNSAAYMRQCIETLLTAGEQAEIILVDDGSVKDDTPAICDEYAAKYPTIVKAIHQENGGHGEGVNQGIRNATGVYFKVVDSDDWLDTDALQQVLAELRAHLNDEQPLDLMMANYGYEHVADNTQNVVDYKGILPEGRVFTWKEIGKFPPSINILMHSGILMPISSLPGGYGIGSMGKPAHDFVDFLAKAGQTIWQILPVGPTGYADSPYQSCSAFAGNPYFIDLDLLAADGLLTKKDYAAINWGGDAAHVDYGTLYEKRFAVLRKAYANFLKKRPVPGYETPYPDDWYRFRFLSSDWLPDYCLYMAIKEANGMVDWQQWPRALRVREPEALAEFKAEHAGEIEFWAFLQYEFDRQWRALHAYAKEKGVAIMGDIPNYVASDSADAWAGRELFANDAAGKPRREAG